MAHAEQAATNGVGRIAVVLSYSGDGGVERMMNNLVRGFLDAGYQVDVVVLKQRGGHFGAIPREANVVALGTQHSPLAAPALARYLRDARPAAVLAAKDRAGRAALRARDRAGTCARVFVRIGNTTSQSLVGRNPLRRMLRFRLARRWYPRADGIIAVSRGVADDIVATSGVERDRVHVIPNPVIAQDGNDRELPCPDHPWLHERTAPVILGVGRLTRQKDFPTLLRAFARLRAEREARLVILGEGENRGRLRDLAADLGVAAAVDLPGFVAQPRAWMAHADLFVLSSAWEGSPNALTEALYVGLPVVATDCRSGPAEILQDGRIAPLVPVGDDAAMASAMLEVLAASPDGKLLRAAAAEYTVEHSVARYLKVLLGARQTEEC